LYFFVLKL